MCDCNHILRICVNKLVDTVEFSICLLLFWCPFTEVKARNIITLSAIDVMNTTILGGEYVLTQELFSDSNTRYIIKNDFLLVEDITVPENCIIEFDGGSISGSHAIVGQNTAIVATSVKIFEATIAFHGSWNVNEIYPEWFGAKGNGASDDAVAIQKALSFSGLTKSSVLISAKEYGVGTTIYIPSFAKILGVDHHFSVLKAITYIDAILQTANNATLITIDNIRLDGNNIASKGLSVGSLQGKVTAHCTFQNIRVKNCVNNNLYFEYLELSQINNIFSEGAKVGIFLNSPLTVYLKDIRVSDSYEVNFQVLNSSNLNVEYLYTFNENVDNQVLCKLVNVSNCTFYHPHFEPQKDVSCNLYITSNGSLSSTYSVNCSGLRFVNPNFCGLNYAGDLIKLSIEDNTNSNRYRPSISNVKIIDGECLIPKSGSYVINNIDCEDLILEDFIQKETGHYAAPALSPILANQINNPNEHSIKQILSFGGKKTLLNSLYPKYIDKTSAFLRFPTSIPAGTYYLCSQRRMTNTEIYAGTNLMNMKRIGQSDDGYKEYFIPLFIDSALSAGHYLKIVRNGFTKYYQDVAFVLSDRVAFVNGSEQPVIPNFGTTNERPMTDAVPLGFEFFDTCIGKPIYAKTIESNGTIIWVDSNGENLE